MEKLVSNKTDAIARKYSGIKARLFHHLDSSKKSKGDIRAFTGVKLWMEERESLAQGKDQYHTHISSLESTIQELERAIRKGIFESELDKLLEIWREEGKPIERKGGLPPILPPPIPSMKEWRQNDHSVVSLFSGAFGLDLGFMAAGFNLRFATDIDNYSQDVAERNLAEVPFILEDFSKVKSSQICDASGLGVGETDVLVGGPPCQPFSTAGKRKGLNDPRSSPLKGFIRAINELRPKSFVMEEVTGLLSSRLKHVPYSERNERSLEPEEQKGSVFEVVLEMLESTGYKFVHGILDAADYGAPQSRRRLIIIGLRENTPSLPNPTHSRQQPTLFNKEPKTQTTFWEATADLTGKDCHANSFSSKRLKYMELVPPGGYWRHLPENIAEEAMGGAYNSGGGRMGYMRRLPWDDVSPTVVTSPNQKSTMLCHPEANRPLSVEEYRRIQGFPDDWDLPGSGSTKYKLIGNAVPVHLSNAIAKHVLKYLGE